MAVMRLLRRKHALLLGVLFIILVASAAVLVLERSEDEDDKHRVPAAPEESVLAHSVEIWRFGPDGRRQWEFVADAVAVGDDTVYRGVRQGRIYTEDGVLTFQADEVVHNQSTGDLRISSNVEVTGEDGSRLKTDKVLYIADESTIYCPERVLIESDDVTASSNSMTWNLDTGVIEMVGEVEVVLESGAVLNAVSLTHNTKDNSTSLKEFKYIYLRD